MNAPNPVGQQPLNEADAEVLFAPLLRASGIVVGVSGGPDSTALMALLALWSMRPDRPKVLAVTIDHGLRPSSRAEAEAVGRAASDFKLDHAILTWDGEKPQTGIQEAARAARYGLLAACAREHGASHIATAHTLDDQAETALIRLAGGSGLAGLAAMRPLVERDGLVHARPFLSVPKQRLVATCDALGAFYLHDPSNDDTRYARVRWRHIMPVLAAEGLTARRLVTLTERAARIEDALAVQTQALLRDSRRADGHYDARAFAQAPFEVVTRALAAALGALGVPESGPQAPRLSRLEALTAAIRGSLAAGEELRRTIGGMVVTLLPDGLLIIEPESARRRGLRKPSEQEASKEAGCDRAAPLATGEANHKLEVARQGTPPGGATATGLVGRDT